jgi:hypothetical protein
MFLVNNCYILLLVLSELLIKILLNYCLTITINHENTEDS